MIAKIRFGKIASRVVVLLGLTVPVVTTVSCGGNGGGGGRNLGIALCDPTAGPFSLDITNEFFPLPVGRQLVLDGEEDGEAIRQVITVLDETEDVAGVTTRVVEERETVDGELAEISRNFFVQSPAGHVCYYGEDVEIYEDGEVVSNEGEWRAGVAGALPGIIMPNAPRVGDRYQQESAPGVAEDRSEVIAKGETITVPAGTFTNTITTFEDTPLEPDSGEQKAYASGIGVVIDGPLELTSSN